MLEVETPTEPTTTARNRRGMAHGNDGLEPELPRQPARSEHSQGVFEQGASTFGTGVSEKRRLLERFSNEERVCPRVDQRRPDRPKGQESFETRSIPFRVRTVQVGELIWQAHVPRMPGAIDVGRLMEVGELRPCRQYSTDPRRAGARHARNEDPRHPAIILPAFALPQCELLSRTPKTGIARF